MDVAIQAAHQSICHRICLYQADRSLRFFPPGDDRFGTQAEELGPRTNHTGPALVVLRGVTAGVQEFHDWLSGSVVFRQVVRVYWLQAGAFPDIESLVADMVKRGPPGGVCRLQCNPRKMEQQLAEMLPLDWELDPREYEHVVSAVWAEGEGYRWSVMPKEGQYKLDTTKPSLRDGHVCRAGAKLSEAMAVTGVLEEGAGNTALDLGAAPGAWTALLAKGFGRVIAIDPAEMDPDVLRLENVTHLQMRAQEAAERLLGVGGGGGGGGDGGGGIAGGGGGGDGGGGGGGVRLIACDINAHVEQCVQFILPLMPALERGGHVILTVKGFGCGRDKQYTADEADRILGPYIEGGKVKCLWLVANTVFERTLVAVKA